MPPGYTPPPASGGYTPPPAAGGYAPPPGQPGGYVPPPPTAGYPAPQYGAPQPSYGNYGPALPAGVVLATPGRRIGAYFLAIPLAIVTLGIGYLIWGLVIWGRGQTPALQVLGMRCLKNDTYQKATFGTMALREIIGRIVENFFFIPAIISFVFMLTRPDRMTIHDLIAGTIVVHDPGKVME
jgi:uncharacterized RDD family membrane protein YckC